MKRTTIASIVLITVVVIVALAAAGFGLYRLGYTHGLTASPDDLMRNRIFHDFGGRYPHDMRRGALPFWGMRQPWFGFPFVGIIPGVLLFIAVAALVVMAINSIARSRRKAHTNDVESSSKDV